jgi:hypothetical protein
MPGAVIGSFSGGQLLISGGNYSGVGLAFKPAGQVQLTAWKSNSGNVYVAFSGGVTVLSGGFPLSGGGLRDGVPVAPGDTYSVPKLAIPNSGIFNIYVAPDAACSGQARVFWEVL